MEVKQKAGSLKVFVGMSGGVDSSVSAALLRARGFDVTGVFIKVWQPDWMECTWREDRLDAMRVAAVLGIPFVTLDLEREYKKEVVDYMVSEYGAGRTPNPDVMCNRYVKFGGFYDWALAQGADYVATGHYARLEGGRLLAGRDSSKDQSYFLWQVSAEKLSKVLFPVGDIEKREVRRLARKFGLPVAEKRDSQGLCFVGKVDMGEFLGHYIPARKGDVLDEAGRVIGAHDGALFLTDGERRGFTITEKSSSDEPYYVVARDVTANTVTVSHKSVDGSLVVARKEVSVCDTGWIGRVPRKGERLMARIRHLGELVPCAVSAIDSFADRFPGRASIVFETPVLASAGQSVVVYDGDECLGGGILV